MKNPTPRVTLLALALLSLGTACSRTPNPQDAVAEDAAASTTVDAAVAAARRAAFERAMQAHAIPGAQLAHAHAGRFDEYAYGVMSKKTGKPVDAQTLFQAASLSKVVGAYIALRFVDEGKLDLDAPLRDYWRSPRIKDGDPAAKITARMVLNHTTGLPNWQISPSNPAIDSTPLESQFAAGTRFHYSGEGYYLLQNTLEHIAGIGWDELARREVFERFDMPASSFLTLPELATRNAAGHEKDGTTLPDRVFPRGNTAWTLVTNARDYIRFIQSALYRGEGLTPETHALMLAESSDADEAETPSAADPYINWGLGVGLETRDGRRHVWHWGDNPGFKAFFMLDPASGDSMVLFTNSENGPASYRELLEQFMGKGEYPALEWVADAGG